MNTIDDAILKLGRSRPLAHEVLFHHRHNDETPPFHRELIEIWHSALQRVCTMAFREGGKSTIAEEALALAANYRLFHNCVIVGNTEKRACERLTAIKYELSTNELMAEMFGVHDEHTSKVWNEAELFFPTMSVLQPSVAASHYVVQNIFNIVLTSASATTLRKLRKARCIRMKKHWRPSGGSSKF